MDDSFAFIAIIGFLLLSAFFSSSETAFFSLSKIQLKKIKKKKTRSSRRIFRLLRNPRELLIIILLGNTIVNVAAASTAAIIAISIGNKYLSHLSQSLIMAVEICVMTILLLIFGEITPKLVSFSSPEKVARFSSFFLEIIKYLLWPIIKILEFISSLFSTRKDTLQPANLTSEDFKNLIKSRATQDSLEENEKKIITSIFRFSSTLAKEIMIPRVDIIAIDSSEGLTKVKEQIIQSGYSRIPIYKKNIDNVIGIVYAKDIILNPTKQALTSFIRPPLFITENVKIQNLLNQFKSTKIQIAIVVDEYGGTAGLLTLEDILEELVGEIMDEYDKEKPMISRLSENEYLISGMYSIAELNEEFNLNIDEEEYDNLAEFLYDNFNKVPLKDESFIYENCAKFIITNIKAQRIHYAKMKLIKHSDETEN
ncbi:MAG: HlyC/CorC family transporter [Candidatus Cloacimonetes bacterium]|nr:HlyC/CorC family transporter [Candidatus Cloacimonadota bacterium]